MALIGLLACTVALVTTRGALPIMALYVALAALMHASLCPISCNRPLTTMQLGGQSTAWWQRGYGCKPVCTRTLRAVVTHSSLALLTACAVCLVEGRGWAHVLFEVQHGIPSVVPRLWHMYAGKLFLPPCNSWRVPRDLLPLRTQ